MMDSQKLIAQRVGLVDAIAASDIDWDTRQKLDELSRLDNEIDQTEREEAAHAGRVYVPSFRYREKLNHEKLNELAAILRDHLNP